MQKPPTRAVFATILCFVPFLPEHSQSEVL